MASCEFQADNKACCIKTNGQPCLPYKLINDPEFIKTVPMSDGVVGILLKGFPGCQQGYKPTERLTEVLSAI